MTNASPTFGAIGPSHVDPRSGEILDADIGLESLSSRNIRTARSQILSATGVDNPFRDADPTPHELALLMSGRVCTYGEMAAEQMTYGDRRPRGARRSRARQPRGRGVRRGLPQGRDDARGRPHARPAPQLPRLARLHAAAARRPGVHARERHRRLGDGVRADQPERRRRAARALRHAVQRHPRAVRLLGDRVRLQAAPSGPVGRRRARRAREDRRPQRRAAARLRHRRGQLHRRRSRDAAVRPRRRRHRLRQEADRDRAGAAQAPGDAHAAPRPGLQRPQALGDATRCATSPAPPTCCRARSAASAPCAMRRAPAATR